MLVTKYMMRYIKKQRMTASSCRILQFINSIILDKLWKLFLKKNCQKVLKNIYKNLSNVVIMLYKAQKNNVNHHQYFSGKVIRKL